MMTWAKVTTRFEGFHRYPDAPSDVAFLRDLHRHMFHITVWIQQFHDERDIEYFQFLRWLQPFLKPTAAGAEWAGSCEFIARSIYELVRNKFPDRKVRVEVSEDGENGALIEDSPELDEAALEQVTNRLGEDLLKRTK